MSNRILTAGFATITVILWVLFTLNHLHVVRVERQVEELQQELDHIQEIDSLQNKNLVGIVEILKATVQAPTTQPGN